MTKLAVIAIGGNSLIKDEAHQSPADQLKAVRATAIHIAGMIERDWNVVITHGNGPQVGFMLLRSELARAVAPPEPLDVCGADTQGAIGYMLQQSLHNEFRQRGIARQCVTMVTQVLVDGSDPAMSAPSKPVGSFYSEPEARLKMEHEGWSMIEDAGRGWRRVVPSPEPREIIEEEALKALISQGFIVVAAGGGGIPVMRDQQGQLAGVEAVIDKDLASSLLASRLKADLFLISTAVEKVALRFRQPDQQDLDLITLSEARRFESEGHFAKGSMGPKVRAAIKYLERGGQAVLITLPESIGDALGGSTGTWIRSDSEQQEGKSL